MRPFIYYINIVQLTQFNPKLVNCKIDIILLQTKFKHHPFTIEIINLKSTHWLKRSSFYNIDLIVKIIWAKNVSPDEIFMKIKFPMLKSNCTDKNSEIIHGSQILYVILTWATYNFLIILCWAIARDKMQKKNVNHFKKIYKNGFHKLFQF
jgi:hypothetical protein